MNDQTQMKLEALYDKNKQIPRLTKLYSEITDEPLAIKLLVHMAIHKRMTVATALGILKTSEGFEKAIEVIESCVQQQAVLYQDGMLIVVIEPSDEIQKEMALYMFPPPMVVEPLKVRRNNETGYLTSKGSVLTRGSHTNDDVCLDVINHLNQMKFTLDLEVLKTSSAYKSLLKPKEGETILDYKKRERQWKKFNKETRELIKNHYSDIEKIYFTHRYDKRGRIYCRGYHLNYQGDEWRKAIIQFEPEHLNEY